MEIYEDVAIYENQDIAGYACFWKINDIICDIYYPYVEIYFFFIWLVTLMFLLLIDLLFYSSGQKYEAPLIYSKSKQISIYKLKIALLIKFSWSITLI